MIGIVYEVAFNSIDNRRVALRRERERVLAQTPPLDYQKMADDTKWPDFEKLEAFKSAFGKESPTIEFK